ncbi:MAG TPA: Holliday junction resolvase RuvX [Turneriella sp.]|nr:Holliday junction resolvase RuvX [Turneriella sp.]
MPENTERLLCIDYGKRFIGFAVANYPGITARALTTFDTQKGDIFTYLQKIIEEEKVNRILLGYPASEIEGEIHLLIQKFRETLSQHTALQIDFVDESNSSQEADLLLAETRIGRKKKRAQDSEAAKLVLLRYLNAESAIHEPNA